MVQGQQCLLSYLERGTRNETDIYDILGFLPPPNSKEAILDSSRDFYINFTALRVG